MEYDELYLKYDGKKCNVDIENFHINNVKIKVGKDSVTGYDSDSWQEIMNVDFNTFVKLVEENRIELI